MQFGSPVSTSGQTQKTLPPRMSSPRIALSSTSSVIPCIPGAMRVFLGRLCPILLLFVPVVVSKKASFYLYTQPGQAADDNIELGVPNQPEPPSFNASLPVVLYIFGYFCDLYTEDTVAVREAHLRRQPVNFIVVDWSYATKGFYGTALDTVEEVGYDTGEFLAGLCDRHGIQPRDILIVGFSLGAHVAGSVGRYLDGQLGIIVGLDPPFCRLPWYLPEEGRLSSGDAQYVQVIHTNHIISGHRSMGHADFFIDMHRVLPLCAFELACAHRMAWKYYARTLEADRTIWGRPCESIGGGTCRVVKGKWPVKMGGYPLDSAAVRGMFAVELRQTTILNVAL